MSSNKLLIAIIAGIVAGALLGGFWPEAGVEVYFLGEFFLKALFMLVVPLVVASIIVGITALGDVRRIGGTGGRTIAFYLVTTGLSVILGIILVNVIQPGYAATREDQIQLRGGEWHPKVSYTIRDNTILLEKAGLSRVYGKKHVIVLEDQDDIRGVIVGRPPDALNTWAVQEWTDRKGKKAEPAKKGTGVRVDLAAAEATKGKTDSISEALKEMFLGLLPENLFKAMAETKVLPLIVFSLIFGGVLTTLGGKGRPVIAFFEGANDAIMKIIHLVMYIAPVGIGALLAGRLGQAGGFGGFWPELMGLGKYSFTVLLGLAVHSLITLPLILKFVARRKVLAYAGGMGTALTTAFSTASSSATLPVTMDCVTEKNGVSKRISSFVLPLGATINMDGTALYEAVAVIFIAQVYGIELGPAQMIVICLTATLAAIGAAGIPEAGLVTMVIVAAAVGVPVEGIAMILPIDWFLDRFRTAVNVWGDSVGAAVVERFEPETPGSPSSV